MKLRYTSYFFQCPISYKTSIAGVVWVVSGVSGWCLECGWGPRSQDLTIPNTLAKFKLGHTQILPFLPVPSIAKTSMSGGVLMVSEGVWMMYRWCLRVSGEAPIPNLLAKNIFAHDSQILHFLPVPCIAQQCLCLGVSELCLGVSGWGLMVSGYV